MGSWFSGLGSMGRGGTRPAARRGGGHDGVLAFPARGRRTRETKARKSTRGEVRGRFPYLNWPRKWRKIVVDGGAVLERLR
jgi:hypothetical protein